MEGEKGGEYEVFGWFKTHVLDSKLETGIEHQELVSGIHKSAYILLNNFQFLLVLHYLPIRNPYKLENALTLGRWECTIWKIWHIHIYSDKY